MEFDNLPTYAYGQQERRRYHGNVTEDAIKKSIQYVFGAYCIAFLALYFWEFSSYNK